MTDATPSTPFTHLVAVMGTVIGFTSPEPLPPAGVAEATNVLHEVNRVLSTWNTESPISRVRANQVRIDHLFPEEKALIGEVLGRCRHARQLTNGAFDPWAMPGGLDPTGLVKGWAAARARDALVAAGAVNVMVNAGGDVAVAGQSGERPWRIGVRHPAQPHAYAAVIEVADAVATSGDYERPGQLIDPWTGRSARVAASATVTGPDLDLADALATGLAVAGHPLLSTIDALDGYEAYLITDCHHFATPGFPFVDHEPSRRSTATRS